jgi:hypothetical protein
LRPNTVKFPVFSLLAGNFQASETGSLVTPPSSGESRANLTSSIRPPGIGTRGDAFAWCHSGQHRHLMMPSPPIRHPSVEKND